MTSLETPAENDGAMRMGSIAGKAEGERFRGAMRELAAGVSLVAAGQGERRSGCTVTSITSLSLEPPTLVLCIGLKSATLAALREFGAFGVSVLAAAEGGLAERFSGRSGIHGQERFTAGDWIELITGAPLLRDAAAAIDCAVEEVLERHTHAIVIGRVRAVHLGGHAPALVHWRGGFASLD